MQQGPGQESNPEQRRELLKALLKRRASEPRAARLSLEQRRLFTLYQLDPESSAYNLLNAYRIEGRLDVAALRWGLQQIVQRHEVLRSLFGVRNGEPVQVVQERADLSWAVIDLRALPEAGRWERAREIAVREAARPFDLVSGPVQRFFLLRLDQDVHFLVLVLHHIVADAWSFKILNEELQALYGAHSRGAASPLRPLAGQYGDFSAWEHRQLADEALESEMRYWEGALEGLEVTELPSDFPRPPIQTHRSATHAFRVPEGLWTGLEAIARERNVSPFVAHLAVFHALLFRYTGNPDVNCGIPVTNRATLEAESMIGFFVNTAVLRTDMADNPSFHAVLDRLQERVRGMVENCRVPFDRLVERLKPHRDSSRNPLYQITFQTGDLPPLRLDGLEVANVFEQDYGISRFDLEVYVGTDGRVFLVYNQDLYRPETIAGLGRRFLRLWEGVVDAPGRGIGDLPMMGEAERHRIVVEWNDTAVPYPGDPCIHELFENQAAENGEAIAAVFEGSEISYGDLNRRANRLAHYLRGRGVGPEVPVGLRVERSLDLPVALLAILKAGGAYVPISRQQPPDRLASILEDSGAALVLTAARTEDDEACAGREVVDLRQLDLSAFPDENPVPLTTGRNLAYMIYTSGSTGRPKGVLIEHRSAIHLGHAMDRLCYRDLPGRKLRVSLNAPIEFDASMQQIIMLTRGHCLVIVPEEIRLDGPAFVRYLAEQQVEALDCTPSHLGILIESGLLDDPGVRLRKILAAGGAIDRRMWDRLAVHPTIESYDIYGPTECTVNATGHPITAAGIAPRIGGPLENYTVYLLDSSMNPVPNGVVGEIYLGGEGVGRGYLARPDLTAGSFVPNPCGVRGDRLYRTGDFARRLDDDTLEFLGRRDDQVKIRGVRIELGEIHAQLLAHGAVRKAVVLVLGEGAEDKHLVAYIVPEGPRASLVDQVRADLKRKFPDFMIPSRFVILEDLPLTPSGKLDRAALPRPKLGQAASSLAHSPIEESLLEIWAYALGIDLSEIGSGSNFFELGGHSLLATRITSRIRDILQIEIQPRVLFSHPTPGELAKVIAELRGSHAAPLSRIERAERASAPPLSFAQERLWFLDQLEPGLAAYNIPIALRLDGALDRKALEKSFHHFVERHEAMRTFFMVQGSQPVQVILPSVELELPFVDLGGLGQDRQEREMRRLAAESGAQPFSLDRYPLFRIVLLRLGEAEHVLLLSLHHILTDAWSIRLMMDELAAFYESFSTSIPAPLHALPVTYGDYAEWQRKILHEEGMEEHLRFWRAHLDVEPPILNLPMDRPRPPVFRYRGANLFFEVPSEEMGRVVRAAMGNSVTVFMFLAGAFQLLLSRYSGEEDIWIGSPVANRGQSELEGLVGLFINMVVLRGDLGRRQTIRELLHQARRTILDASDHQQLPFEKLVEALNPERSMSHSPLFQCMLTFQSHTGPGLELGGVKASLLQMENSTAKLDLTFDLSYTGERLEGRIEYNTDIFDSVTALRLSRDFQALVHEMALRQDATLGDLPLLGSTERFQLTREWNDTGLRHPEGLCIHQLFERRAAEKPERTAVVCGEDAVSYGELNERANRLAHFLMSRCRDPKAKVGIYLRRSVDMVAAVLGVLKAGKTYVPLDPVYPQDRIQHILETSDAELVLTDAAFAERLAGLPASLEVERVRMDDRGPFLAYPAVDPLPQADPEDLAYVIFTSGSTGHPKGVVLQHRPVVNLIEWVNKTYAVGEGDGLLFVTSLCFDLSVYDIFGTLAAGATVFVADDREVKDPELLMELLYTRPITFWDSAPAALFQLEPFFDAERGLNSRLRLVFLSGDWIPLALLPAVTGTFPQARVIGLGGATEAAIWSNFFPVDGIDPHWKSIPYGRPIQNARYYVLDRDLHPCPINVAGDLYIGGGCLSTGYLKQPVQTARQYIPDPFGPEPGAVLYSTGDRARWRGDGNLEFLGRVDAQVKIRGFRIELGEIEAVLESHEAVQKAVVLVRADRPGDKRLVAYVQPRAGDASGLLREDLLHLLGSKLPDYMIPSHFVVLERWPVTPNGKLDRKALPAPRLDEARSDASVRAETAEQETLARIWAEVLGLERVGIHDNFFTLGGDSILAIQIVARAGQAGLRVRPRDFFQTQTVATMLPQRPEGHLQVDEQADEVEVLEAALTPVQRWFFSQGLENPHHFNQAVLLEWKQPLDTPRLLAALHQLCARHDSLRLRFVATDAGWRQEARPVGSEGVLSFGRVSLDRVPPDRLDEALDACATDVQGSLDIAEGPLVAACLFEARAGRQQQLLLAVHHLAVDGVSWRILLEDLEALYQGAPLGDSGSWMQWAGRLDREDVEERFRPEMPFWLRQGRRHDLLCDFSGGAGGGNRASSAETVVARLTSEETGLLERKVPGIYRTGWVDVLLAALARALHDGSESLSLTVDLEAHGRSHELGDADLSRTVGWFTSIYPLTLEAPGSASHGTLLKSVKEQRRAVPREGVGYGVLRYLDEEAAPRLAEIPGPQILFNYLGRFDRALMDNDLFRVHTDRTGRDMGADNERTHLLEINSLTVDGVFETRWRFSRGLFRPATVERLVGRFTAALREILDHCLSPDAGGRTPSDFPLAAVRQDELDLLVARHPDLEDLYPATAMQQGMLFHGDLEPDTPVYVQQISLDIPGSLDPAAFRSAWEGAIARHACLRTLFHIAGGRYLQAVLSGNPSFWTSEDWRGLAEAEQRARLETFLSEDLGRGFALDQEPPFRVSLVRLGDERHHLVVTYHHAILDGWSLAILLEEISEFYQARSQGRPAALSPAQPLREHAAWLAVRDAGQAQAFWRPYLQAFNKPNQIVRAGSLKKADQGQRSLRVTLPRELVSRIEQCSRGQRLTRSTIFQAAWALLVGRYSNSSDVVVGVTTSGREQGLPGIERMLGLFINTLPLRVATDEDLAVDAWLQGVQRNLFEIRQRDDSSLAEIQACSGLPPGQPLFESIVVVENYPFSEALVKEWLGHGAENIRIHERASYPLSLLVELRSELVLEISYEARHFDDLTVRRMLQHLQTLLAGIAQGAASLAGLEMLSEAERHQLVLEANDSADGWSCMASLPEVIALQAEATPDRVAVAFRSDELRYADLVDQSERLARYLRDQGVAPGDRVGLWMERSVEAIVAILAVMRAGAAYVPIDLDSPQERVELVLRDSRAAWVLTKGLPLAFAVSEICPEARILDLQDLDLAGVDLARSLETVDPGQPAYVIYTSGSTGKPKGVVVEHRSVLNLLNGMQKLVYDGCEGDGLRLSVNAPFAFDASMQQILMLARGHSLHIVPEEVRKDGRAFVDFLAQERLEGLDITPTHLGLLLEAGLLSRPDLALRRVVVAGGAIDPAMWDRLAGSTGARFFNIYGPTECTVNATGRPVDVRGAVPSIGRPLANYRVHVLDSRLRPVPMGVPGQLFLGGSGLAEGYHERPGLTAERFIPDPFSGERGVRLYQTGDLVRFGETGELEFLGRVDHQVKIRGFRVELEEIESTLLGHPEVSRAVVVLDGSGADARLVAFYTALGGRDLPREDLRAFVRRTLPDYMVPSELIRLEAIPLLANGKVARQELPKAGELRRQRVPARTPTEERLAAMWAEVLGIEPTEVGVFDDFLSLGGHSLNTVLLLSRIQSELGLDLSLKSLYEGATIHDIAARITSEEEDLLESDRALELMGELQGLSQEEILALLGDERAKEALPLELAGREQDG